MTSNLPKKQCIVFNRSNAIYYAGEEVTGTINLPQKKVAKCQEILLKVEGKTSTNFMVPVNKGNNIEYANVHGNEEVFNYQEKKLQHSIGQTSDVVTFPFSFFLHDHLPSSYDGAAATTFYELKVILDIKDVKLPPYLAHSVTTDTYNPDRDYKSPLTVVSSVNLNMLPNVRAPYSVTVSKNIFSGLVYSNKGVLHMTVAVPVTAYVSGENIPIKCILNNQSTDKVKEVKVYIVQSVTLAADGDCVDTARVKKLICKVVEGVRKKEEKVIDASILLPNLTPSTLLNETKIKIAYSIKAKAKMSGIGEDLECEFPIVIGTVPFMN